MIENHWPFRRGDLIDVKDENLFLTLWVQRLEIARALATEPKVLLLDELAAGMNLRNQIN